jgi:mannose-6-phosphate isomerase-like protein (cupin superfamily)
MVRKDYIEEIVDGAFGGTGKAKMEYWLSDQEKASHINMCCTISLEPGATVGEHEHHGQTEIYRIISGLGLYNDNGTQVDIEKGDVLVCYSGQKHGLINTADMPLIFDAVIIAE